MSRRFGQIVLLALTISALTGCQRSRNTIQLGVVLSTSGPAAPYGIDNRNGLRVAEEIVNGQGGIAGRKLLLDIQDSGGDPAQAVLLARRFASDSAVPIVLGPTRTGETVAVARILPDLRIPIISIGSTGDWKAASGGDFNQWTFRSTRVDSALIEPLLRVARDRFGIRSLGLIYANNDDWSQSLVPIYRAAITKLGLRLVDEENIPLGEPNRGAQLTKLKNAAPDALIVNSLSSDAPSIAGQARRMGYKGLFIGTAGFTNPATFKLADPGALDGTLVGENYFAGSPRPIVQEFVRRFEERFHQSPPPYAAYAADGLFIAVDALKRAGTTNRSAVRDAIGKTNGLEGLLGTLTYHGSGDAEKTPLVLQIKGNSYSLVQ